MQVVRDVKTNTKKLLISKDQWERINKSLTKKDDNRAALEKIKRSKDEQIAKSKAIVESWDNPHKVC